MTALEVDIFSDIVCPWCFIGTRRLHAVLTAAGDEVEAVLRHHPYLLHPDAPAAGIDLRDMLAAKYGGDPALMFARVEAIAREEGIPLDFARQSRTYSTIAAHTLLRHAHERGTQAALADALFSAYFLDGRNIADAAVLADVALHHGFTGEEVHRLVTDDVEIARTRRDAQAAAMSGIRGVPLFVFNRQFVLSGAQSRDTFRAAIARAQAMRPAAPQEA